MTGAHVTPYDFAEAKAAASRAAANQIECEKQLVKTSTDAASAEKRYRLALAKKIVDVHANGAAWTVAQDLARGDEDVAELRYQRDVARGVFEAQQQAAWRHAADRKDLGRLIDWSARSPDGSSGVAA
jgi:hypothetical protein